MAVKEKRLPVKQLVILSICRFAEPVVLTSVFPYLPEMIESFAVPKADVAKWAGITAAVFSLCQCVTAIAWGRASDRFGRKPTILLGLANTMVTSVGWGLSTSVPMAIAMRALAGAGNGNVGIIRTMVAEMVPWKELQPRAFSVMPLVWGVGSVFGPAIGGSLANPMRVRPGEPHGNSLFERFPYLLPNLVASVLFLTGILTGFLFLEESLESVKNRRDYGLMLGRKLSNFYENQILRMKNWWRLSRGEETEPLLKQSTLSENTVVGADDEESSSQTLNNPRKPKSHSSPPPWSSVFTLESVLNLIAYTLLAFHSLGYDQLLPIFMHHPVQDRHSSNRHLPFKFAGGFGNNSQQIGLLFTIYGFSCMLGQFLFYPPVARRYGVLFCFRFIAPLFPIVYILTPYTALLPTDLARRSTICVLMLLKGIACVFAFPSSTILITNSARSLKVLGTLNGVSVSMSAMGRAAGPALGGLIFSCAVKRGYVIVPWWLFAAVAVLGAVPLWFVEEGKGFGDDDDDDNKKNSINNNAVNGVMEDGDGEGGNNGRYGNGMHRESNGALTASGFCNDGAHDKNGKSDSYHHHQEHERQHQKHAKNPTTTSSSSGPATPTSSTASSQTIAASAAYTILDSQTSTRSPLVEPLLGRSCAAAPDHDDDDDVHDCGHGGYKD